VTVKGGGRKDQQLLLRKKKKGTGREGGSYAGEKREKDAGANLVVAGRKRRGEKRLGLLVREKKGSDRRWS